MGTKKDDLHPLVGKVQQMCADLGIDGTFDDNVVNDAISTHNTGILKDIIKLADPNADRVKTAKILDTCKRNSKPEVVKGRLLADIDTTIAQAATFHDIGPQRLTLYSKSRQVVKSVRNPDTGSKKRTSTDKSSQVDKGNEKSVS